MSDSEDEPFAISSGEDTGDESVVENLSDTESDGETGAQDPILQVTYCDAVTGEEISGAETTVALPDPVDKGEGKVPVGPKEKSEYVPVKTKDGTCPGFVACEGGDLTKVTVYVIQGAAEQKKLFKVLHPKKPATGFLAKEAKELNEGNEKTCKALKTKHGEILMGDAMIKEILEKKKKRKAPTVVSESGPAAEQSTPKKKKVEIPTASKAKSLFKPMSKPETPSAKVKVESPEVLTPIRPAFDEEPRKAELTPSEIGMVKKFYKLVSAFSDFIEK